MLEFEIQSMTCGHCVSTVTRAIHAVDPQAKVEIDLPTHKLRVQTTQDRAGLVRALAEAGYAPA